MTNPYSTKTLSVARPGAQPLQVNFITWTPVVFGPGVPVGPVPFATDAPNPKAPNVAKK